MKRFRKKDEAVSPVIATILMVAITVVLAGVLVVYLQTLPTGGGEVETAMGLRATKTSDGDWIIEITSGSKTASTVTVQCVDPKTGKTDFSEALTDMEPADNNANGVWNDNNNNAKLDAGDSILLDKDGGADAGDKIQLLVSGNIVGTVKALPD
ncbi:MAG: archaellin/type IV pilin N-terminal domain-containing protein [Thermoplasmatota archaeon]